MSSLEDNLLTLLRIFGNKDVCLEWLKTPQGYLGNKTPLMAMALGDGETVVWLAEIQAGSPALA